MIEQHDDEIGNPIEPHSYSIILKIIMIMLCAGFLYFCLFFFPKYYKLHSIFRHAEQEFFLGNYADAIKGYKSVLGHIKNFKMARIRTAQARFVLNQNQKALKILSEISLDMKEWEMLKKYMPENFEVHFKRKVQVC